MSIGRLEAMPHSAEAIVKIATHVMLKPLAAQ